MSQRKVFGRVRRFDYLGNKHTIEMRQDGVYIRQFRSRTEWKVPFSWMFKFCHNQLEMFNEGMDKGDQSKPMPSVPEGQLVPDRREGSAVHESPKPASQNAEQWGDGLAARIKCDHKFIDSNTCIKCGWNPEDSDASELSEVDERLDAGHPGPDGGLPG